MALWLIFALMTGAAAFVVLASLARSRLQAGDATQADAAVYRDQIEEIARDRARGLIDEREADGARTEVARRLIAASEQVDAPATERSSIVRRRIAAAIALVAIPTITLGAYAGLGRPDMPDMPLASRKNEAPDMQNLANLAVRVEQALAANPEDGRGWAVVGPVYMRLGRPEDAARAYANAIRLLGSSPEFEANLGEAFYSADDGVVTARAREAFERSVAGDEPSLKGSFYLSRAAEQDGDLAGAVSRLKTMLAKAPADAPYLDALREEFQRIAAVPPMPMLSTDQANTAPEDRPALIRTMVDRLGDRLAAQGGDLGEWLRLVRARATLGEAEKARQALASAREKFAGDGRASTRLEALALGLGLEGRGA